MAVTERTNMGNMRRSLEQSHVLPAGLIAVSVLYMFFGCALWAIKVEFRQEGMAGTPELAFAKDFVIGWLSTSMACIALVAVFYRKHPIAILTGVTTVLVALQLALYHYGTLRHFYSAHW